MLLPHDDRRVTASLSPLADQVELDIRLAIVLDGRQVRDAALEWLRNEIEEAKV